MKAIVQRGYGAPEQVLGLEDVETPAVGDDEVLVRMRASSVNTPDWLTVTGTPYVLRLRFGLRGPRTAVRGSDVAGVVETVGKDVTGLEQGDEVFGSSWADDLATSGTFAEYAVAPGPKLVRKPAGLTFEDAAASVMSGLTALIAIRDVAEAGPNTRLLINGASGGVGTFAVQIAKTLGAEVTGVCSAKNLELVSSLGADHVIDYTNEDFTQAGKRYDVILDNVMNYWPPNLSSALAPEGMLIPNSIGTTGRHVREHVQNGAGGPDGTRLNRRKVRQARGESRQPERPCQAPRVRRSQAGHRHSLPARRGPRSSSPHAGTSRRRQHRHHDVRNGAGVIGQRGTHDWTSPAFTMESIAHKCFSKASSPIPFALSACRSAILG